MKHDLEERYNGFGYTLFICKNCGMEATRFMGRFLKWTHPECKPKEDK